VQLAQDAAGQQAAQSALAMEAGGDNGGLDVELANGLAAQNGAASPVVSDLFVPLSIKVQSLEDKVYVDISRLAGAFSLASSGWNSNPDALTPDSIVLRAKECLPSPETGEKSLGWQRPSQFQEGIATSWRTLHYRRDSEAPVGMRVMVVTDTENDAKKAWAATLSTTSLTTAAAVVHSNETSTSLVQEEANASVKTLKALSAFKGELELGAETHNTAHASLRARATVEALGIVAQSSPTFVSTVEGLLRLVRPLSFSRMEPHSS
jgi:hypothetical protein